MLKLVHLRNGNVVVPNSNLAEEAWMETDAAGNILPGGGSKAVIATVSFLPIVGAYTANDIIDVAKQVAWRYTNGVAIPANSIVRLTATVLAIDETAIISGETTYALQCYSVTPPSGQADNAAWSLASADLPSYLGSFTLGTPADLGSSAYIKQTGLSVDINLTTDKMYAELQTGGGFTATATAHQVTLMGYLL